MSCRAKFVILLTAAIVGFLVRVYVVTPFLRQARASQSNPSRLSETVNERRQLMREMYSEF